MYKDNKNIISDEYIIKVEEEHGFLGSVMVSAKDGDGSGDAAIQSLTR